MTPLEAAWQAVLEHPDAMAPRAVLADALLDAGEPLGELLRLGLAGDEDEVQAWVAAHAELVLGEADRLRAWRPRFRQGFIDAVALEDIEGLRALFSLPLARLLRLIDVGSHFNAPMETLVNLLVGRGPSTLQALYLGRPGLVPYMAGVVRVAPLLRSFGLKELVLGSWSNDFSGVQSGSLERLTVNMHHATAHFGEARLPSLASLRLFLPFEQLPLPVGLLAGEVAPRLSSLTIFGALWPSHVAELSVSALLRGLRHVEIASDAATGWVEALLETADRFQGLERIDVRINRRPDLEVALRDALPRIVVHGARVGGV